MRPIIQIILWIVFFTCCVKGKEVQEDLCPTLNDDGIFEIFYSKNREIGSTARYFCRDVTRNITGSHVRTCKEGEEWSGFDDQQCTESMVRCPVIDEEGDFFIAYSNEQKVHSLARYFCKDPTRVVLGTKTKLCLDTGEWSGPHDQKCIESDISCPVIRPTDDFIILYTNGQRIANSIARYFCRNASQQIRGTNSRVCLETGEWSGSNDQTCGQITCPEFPVSDNMRVYYSNGRQVGSAAKVLCAARPGRRPRKVISRCLPNGTWRSIPSCEEITCREHQPTDLLFISYSDDRKVGSFAMFYCRPPGQLIGASTSRCMEDGKWEGAVPMCTGEITCPLHRRQTDLTISYTLHRKVGGFANFHCTSPAQQVGVNRTRCLENGEWADPIPTCKTITCQELQQTDLMHISYTDGRKVGSFANFRCTHPAQRLGASRTRCLEDGKWADPIPTCSSKITCPEHQQTDLLYIAYSEDRKVGSFAMFYCRPPGQLIGARVSRCMEDGRWEGVVPMCTGEITCPELQQTDLTISYTLHRKVGSFANFHCTSPAQQIGVNRTRCLENGEWADPIPTCKTITCQELQQTDLMHISYTDDRKVGSIAKFRCTQPAQRLGVSRTRCLEDGKWADPIPTCSSISLCDLDDLLNILPKNAVPATYDMPSNQVPEGFELELLCEDGLLLKGSPTVKCTSGEWLFGPTLSKPYCSEACMLKIEASSRLIVYPEKEYFFLGEFAHFSCPYRYKLTPRVEKAMCMARDWSDPAPNCEPL